ncbi:MAG: protein kinase [Planctomycetes bacterium]|nr:protein kinase [Planctomycetota bacterium]
MTESDADFDLARRAVDLGWLDRRQVEAAIESFERTRGTRLLAHLPLTPEQIRNLQSPRSIPAEAATSMKEPSNRIGRFWRVRKLGSGGMGMVFLAWDPDLSRWVALKFLKSIGDERERAFFRREAQLAAALDHPAIAKMYEIGEHEGAPYIAMEFVDGTTLAAAKLSAAERVRAATTVAEAVAFAHGRGIIHRDLKPANVMVDRHGRVFVMDFGLAKEVAVDAPSLTGTNAVLGTPNYMAPEQARGKATAQSDVYSIGAILYELVTGRPPFVGDTAADVLMQVISAEPIWPRRLAPGTAPDLEAVILKALEKDPRRRYADVPALLEDLRALQDRAPLRHARRPTWGYVMAKRVRRQPLLWGLGAAAVAAVIGGGTFGAVSLAARARADRQAKRQAEARSQAEARGREEAERRVAAEEEGRRRVEAKQEQLVRALAHLQAARARQAAESGDFTAAAILYAEANRLAPSTAAGVNAEYFLSRHPVLSSVQSHSGIVFGLAWDEAGDLAVAALGSCGLEKGEYPVALSPDGESLATSTAVVKGERREYLFRIRRRKDGTVVSRERVEVGFAPVAAFAPDGRIVYVHEKSGEIRARRLPGLEEVSVIVRTSPGQVVMSMCLSPDGSRMYVYAGGLYEVADGRTRLVYGRADSPVLFHRMGAVPETTLLLVAAGKGAGLFDLRTQRVAFTGAAHDDYVDAWDVSPDRRVWATGSRDGSVRFWSFPDCKPAGPLMRVASGVASLLFTRDGKALVAGSYDGRLYRWELPDTPWKEWEAPVPMKELVVAPGGDRWIVQGHDGLVRVVDGRSGQEIGNPLAVPDAFSSFLFSGDSGRVGVLSKGKIQVVDLRSGIPLGEMARPGDFDWPAFLPDGRMLVTQRPAAWVWTPGGKSEPLPEGVYAVVPGTALLVEASVDRLRLRDVQSARVLAEREISGKVVRLHAPGAGKRGLCQFEGGRVLVFRLPDLIPEGTEVRFDVVPESVWLTEDGSVIRGLAGEGEVLWSLKLGRALKPPPAAKGSRRWEGIRYDPHFKRAAVQEGAAGRFWDLEKGEWYGESFPWESGSGPAQFSPDGRSFVVTTQNSLRRIDATNGRLCWAPATLPAYPDDMEFEPSGGILMIACRGEGIQFFDLESGAAVGMPFPHAASGFGLRSRMFHDPRAGRLVSGHEGRDLSPNTIRVWDARFLMKMSDPASLRDRAMRITGARVSELGAVEALPVQEWEKLGR